MNESAPMPAERFQHDTHRHSVDGWCKERGMSVFPEGWLPTVGFIVPGVLAAWLYKTDSGLAYMENIISNPATTAEERSTALDAVADAIVEEARSSGFSFLLGFSAYPTISAAALRHGFTVTPDKHHTLIKRLS